MTITTYIRFSYLSSDTGRPRTTSDRWHIGTVSSRARCGASGRVTAVIQSENPPAPLCGNCTRSKKGDV